MVSHKQLENEVIKQCCEADPLFFTRYFFKIREGIKFITNWHHEKIAETFFNPEAE